MTQTPDNNAQLKSAILHAVLLCTTLISAAYLLQSELGQIIARQWALAAALVFAPFYKVSDYKIGMRCAIPFCFIAAFGLGYIAYEVQGQVAHSTLPFGQTAFVITTTAILSMMLESVCSFLFNSRSLFFGNRTLSNA